MTHTLSSGRELVAGVDSSTQSTKVELRDADTGALVATGQAPHPPVTPPASEQDPRAWWDAFVAAFREAHAAAGGAPVIAISVAAQCHGLVALDSAGEPVRPAKLWNDTTSAAQMTRLLDDHRPRRVRAHDGHPPDCRLHDQQARLARGARAGEPRAHPHRSCSRTTT